MTMPQTLYDAYLLRIWQEERVDESSAPTCYYLIEQIFGARQRWLFTDVAEFHTQLRNIFVLPSSITQKTVESHNSARSGSTDCSLSQLSKEAS